MFTDITLFSPFTYFETDGETYIHIYPPEPIDLSDGPPDMPVVTFETILDWGVPGGATPFTYVEHDASGYVYAGSVYNLSGGVGGVAESLPAQPESLPIAAKASRSSAPLYGAVAGGAALVVLVLGGAGWYARRRWLQ